MDIYQSARKHGITDDDITHAVQQAVVAADVPGPQSALLGPDRAGNMLEVVTVVRKNGTEIVIHAMRMRRIYEPLLRETGEDRG